MSSWRARLKKMERMTSSAWRFTYPGCLAPPAAHRSGVDLLQAQRVLRSVEDLKAQLQASDCGT